MKSTTLLLPLLTSLAAAQIQILDFGSGQLPACAQTCQTLLNAQAVCVPPSAPVTTAATYKSCFCQSGYLNTLDADASTICDTTCTSQTDRTSIQSWYESYCANAADLPSGTAAGASTSAAPAATTTAAGAATTTVAGTTTSNPTSSASASSVPGGDTTNSTAKGWWPTHARWVAMVIVLVIGFTISIFLGLWIRRRYRTKHYGLGQEAPPLVWGPHQNQHATGGVMYPGAASAGQVAAEKGKGPVVGQTPRPKAAAEPRTRQAQDPEKGGSKLKKFMGR